MATPRPDSGAGATAGSDRSTGTMGAPGLRQFRIGGAIVYVDKNAQAMHIIDRTGRIVPLPKGAHFNAQKNTIDLPDGDHLTISRGQVVRNTPKPKTNKLTATTYYKNPYTGPSQKVDKLGFSSAPKPVQGGVQGPVLPGHAPGSAPVPPPSTAPTPVKAPVKVPAKTVAAPPVKTVPPPVKTAPPVTPPTGGRTSAPAPTAGRTPATGAPVAQPAPATTTAPTAGSVAQRVTELFGPGMAVYLNNRDLGPILRKAAAEGWSSLRLQGAIQGTNWWKITADSARKYDLLSALDHATAKAQVDAQSQQILDSARADGLSLNPLQIHDLSVNALRNGWTAPQLRQKMYDLVGSAGLGTAEQTRYGYLAGLADNPEVKALLTQGAREGWDQNRLLAALQGTQFWQQTTDAQRKWQALTSQDPGTAKDSVTQQTTSILNTAQALGVTLDPTRAGQIAEDSLRFGWNPEQISKAVGAEYHYNAGTPGGGTASKSAADLKQLAAQYMVPISDQTLGSWTENIIRGQTDENAFTDYLKQQAKILRPWAANQIDAGLTMEQITDPYKQLVASTLEMAPDQVDFTNARFAPLLDGNPQPGATGTDGHGPMSLSQAGAYLRSLDEYKQTAQAKQQAADFTVNLLKDFGKVAV